MREDLALRLTIVSTPSYLFSLHMQCLLVSVNYRSKFMFCTDCCCVSCRFYIESVAYLKDATTVELFFRNAKISVYNVSDPSIKIMSDQNN